MTTKQNQAFSAIREAIAEGARNFLVAFRQDWIGETMYGFLLETSWEGTSVEAVAGTEEGLLRIARYYANREGKQDEESLDLLCAQLRWESPEDGWYADYDAGFFEKANQLLSEVHKVGLMEIGDGQLQNLCLEALRELDTAGTFETNRTRERIAIGVCYVGGDQTEKEFLRWAEVVNPLVVVQRLRYELQKSNELFEATK
jgi:hypothetical protein